nr:MAG TPA: hypothetical protein [Caudoviricetes sp.]
MFFPSKFNCSIITTTNIVKSSLVEILSTVLFSWFLTSQHPCNFINKC